jgi:hypothetical protein
MKRTPTVQITYNDPGELHDQAQVRVPVIPNINERIEHALKFEESLSSPDNLDMRNWHGRNSCGTTHCIAGFAVAVSGRSGKRLESELGTERAAGLIFQYSLLGEVPDFFTNGSHALYTLKDRVAREADAIESAKLSGEAVQL